MKQTDLGLDLTNRRTRKRAFLDEMERTVPWRDLVALVSTHSPVISTQTLQLRLTHRVTLSINAKAIACQRLGQFARHQLRLAG